MALTRGKKTEIALWTAQVLLAALFLFAGGVKLAIPMDALAQQAQMPGPFLKFIAVAELLGGIGIVLPTLLRIQPGLTPLAAAGLTIIMVGATVTSVAMFGIGAGIMPLVTGIVAASVAYGRWRLAPVAARGRAIHRVVAA